MRARNPRFMIYHDLSRSHADSHEILMRWIMRWIKVLICHWRLDTVDDVPVRFEDLEEAKALNQKLVLEAEPLF